MSYTHDGGVPHYVSNYHRLRSILNEDELHIVHNHLDGGWVIERICLNLVELRKGKVLLGLPFEHLSLTA